jgi:hypothetical protein
MILSDFKIRCSAIGKIMTDPRAKKDILSATCKTYLIERWIEVYYGRIKDVSSKYLEKGKQVEEDSITLYSRIKKQMYKKNTERLTNDYVTGEPDLYMGKDIIEAERVIDFKSSWSLNTYIQAREEGHNDDYDWQGQGYMWLTGSKHFTLAYCLINTPKHLVLDEKKKLAWRMGIIDDYDNPEYIEASKQIDRNHNFDDIPMQERMFEINIDRDDDKIEAIKERVIQCREWLNETFISKIKAA